VARRVGAVNTVMRAPEGWVGYNTDYAGFQAMLDRAGIAVPGADFSILGSGGAARGAALRLVDSGAAAVRVFSRSTPGHTLELTDARGKPRQVEILPYSALEGIGMSVFVNATPLGTDPNQDCPLPPRYAEKCQAAVDLVYNPFLTPFLRQAVSRGIPSADGLDMLVVQAVKAFELWNGIEVGPELAERALETVRLMAASGIALVGMPLSGKSTLLAGLPAAGLDGIAVADLDAEIEKASGKDIPAIFAAEGEAGFRAREHRALAELVKGPHIIACGGGALTRDENLALLRKSLIVFVDVPMAELKRRYRMSMPGTRPLLKSEADLEALYAKRLPVYASASRARAGDSAARALMLRWLEVRNAHR
jgi:shikimate dehydrogenase